MTRERIRDSQFEYKPTSRNLACASCGKRIEHRAGRRPRFCSDRCPKREFDEGRVRKAFLGRDTGGPTKLRKKSNDFKALQGEKMLSSHRIFGHADVLALEVFDRAWQSAVSSGGVEVQIGRLRERTLLS